MNIYDECEVLKTQEDEVVEGIPPVVTIVLVVIGVLLPA